MMIEANIKDLYLVLVALSFLCVGLGAMLMWMVSERQHERHVQEIEKLIEREVVTYADNGGNQAAD